MACAKCQGEMEEGYLPDTTYGGFAVMSWLAGAPQRSFWRGLSFNAKERVPVEAYRCTACGYLEFYARPE